MVVDELIKSAGDKMVASLVSLQNELAKVRTGRANPAIVENVRVEYYGSETPLKNVAAITLSDARTIVITPWEKHLVKPIEKAISKAELGLNPVGEADLVRITVPPLTEDRRRELVKVVKGIAEKARVSVRNARHDALGALKAQVKAKEVNEDTERRTQEALQKLTDKQVGEVDRIAAIKEQELMGN